MDGTRVVVSAKERAYRHTKAAILDGRLPGGDLISEGQVAEVLAMSRTPVREAFLRLEAEGLLRLFPKRGALVVPVSPAEVEAVLEARELVEGHAVTKLCATTEPERAAVVARLREVLAEQRAAFAAGDEQAFAEGDRRFHTVLVESAGNPILSELYTSLRDRQLRMNLGSLLGHGPARAEEILGQHEAILAALGPDRSVEAHGRLSEHLEATRTAVLGR
ncbi:GntR family transcriptional regulator [Actinomycetospora corticicola]|uniref:DNA-binding GntR family transcriptional regulator n=1 Tax=Actinomycetospora corticicola TaxID=663602 RepID=A0A7Y9J7Y6_9PSEU|nr:DNA-binding GntR family transcriptional regulator [Actinomycetospora corticicola]